MTFAPRYLTVREAADFLGISVQRVWQLVEAGKLSTVQRRNGYRSAMAHISRGQLEYRKSLATVEKSK